MNTEVIFDVLSNVRFNVLGGIKTPTPVDFSAMDALEKVKLYDKMFDAWCHACESLSALMTIIEDCKQLQGKEV